MVAESARQAKAFDLYYTLGEKRSYEAVSDRIGVSKTSVYKWAKMFNWQDRVKKRDEEIVQRIYEESNKDIIKSVSRYRQIINASIESFVKAKNGQIPLKSSMDFIKLVELDLRLAGVLDEKSEVKDNGKTVVSFTIKE